MSFSKTLEAFELNELINKECSIEDYQRAMAAVLREKVFLYLMGKLRDRSGRLIQTGPAAKEVQKKLDLIGGMDNFIRRQSPSGAWATDIELTLLAELLGVNFIVETPETRAHGKPMVLSPEPDFNKPIVVLYNTDNQHWDAIVDGEKREALGDNNCGYNSFALSIKELALSSPKVKETPKAAVAHALEEKEKCYYKPHPVEEYKNAETQFENAMSALKKTDAIKYEAVKNQIEADAQLAWKLAFEDLAKTSEKTKSAYSYLAAVCDISAAFFQNKSNNKTESHSLIEGKVKERGSSKGG